MTWKQPDGDHFNGFCTNRFRQVTTPAGVKVNGGCHLCVHPATAYHSPCCCPAPKLSHRVLTLTAVYTGGGVQPCYITPAFGTFLLYGNDCGFVTKEKFVSWTSVMPETCTAPSSNAQRWYISPTSCFLIGDNKWMQSSLVYSYRTPSGSVNTIPFTGTIPACNDVNGSWKFSNGSFPNWDLTVSGLE